MVLTAGVKLGPYEIVSPLGAGGMGEVYRARDTRLERTVAIKILPDHLSANHELKLRFEREARAISQLQHPHICVLHDVGSSNGTNYLVMEYLEGETLADRVFKGPLPLDQLLKVGIEIADALNKAHRSGIIHRDLKPANIMLTKSGAKLMDFGLARGYAASVSAAASAQSGMPSFTATPTLTNAASPLTGEGTILGTLNYMSPEQIEGKEADARSDIFAFGAVLYEMAAGKRAFDGKSHISVASAILEKEPEAITAIKPITPPALDRVVKKCLAKVADERWQSASDLASELKWIRDCPAASPFVAKPHKPLSFWIAIGMPAIVAIIALLGWWRATRPVDHPLTRLNVDLGPDTRRGFNTTVAISPDGRRLVFPMAGADGVQRLATRLLDQPQPTLLNGTENGKDAFFSPDGQWIGFVAGNQLKKISVQGSAPVTLDTSFSVVHGAAWGEDGNIVTELGSSVPLSRIPASGGPHESFTKLASAELSHRWPQYLPGANAVLYTASPSAANMENANIKAISLRTGEVKLLLRGGYYGRFVPTGHLLYVHRGVLFGVKFDVSRLEVRGSPVPLLDDVASNPSTGGGQFDFSATGTFLYIEGKSAGEDWQMAWLDSSGRAQPLALAPESYAVPRLSPDGKKLAFLSGSSDIYVHDLERDTTTRLSFTGSANTPVWAPDGRHIIFTSEDGLSWTRSDGATEPLQVLNSPALTRPWSFSPDGRWLAYFEITPESGFDIRTLPLDLADPDHPKVGKPTDFLHTRADELVPRFSPDGRWIAYRSNESGTTEIYVRPFPAGNGGKWQISTGGGMYALWSNNGRELFYETTDNRIMVVDYTVNGQSFVPGRPRLWSDKQLFYTGTSNLDLAPDGKRFLMFSNSEHADDKGSVHVTMLLNFFDELKRRIP